MRALLTAAFLLTTLLLTAHQASAAPPTAAGPPDILTPTEPPRPRPCEVRPVPCDLTLSVATPTTGPSEPSAPTEPSDPSAPSITTTSPGAQVPPTGPATGDRTARDDGTAAGPARGTAAVRPPAPTGTQWWLVAVPVLALLALAAAGTVLLIQRSERRPH
ncbi:hypothetical protein [Actinophytocola sp.]|uniref:hypothetical protein n=1 Tax=Actinophytocola sp. TaxID=1872138 RepID=UPI003899F1D2